MRRVLILPLAAALLAAASLTGPVRAQDQAPKGAPGKGAPPKTAPGKEAPGAKTDSVTGPVKGVPTGKTFVIARKGGTVTVDAAGATIRQNGKFASIDAIKGGTMVTAKGTLTGTNLKATEVTVHGGKAKGKEPGKK